MYYGGWGWRPYVSVAQRQAQAMRKIAQLKKKGRVVSPVEIEGRGIATTFWGKAWCENLERYGDYANRLPRGRTYVRNGSVIDLQIAFGEVKALVSGSSIYKVAVKITPVSKARWKSICKDCAGAIDSLVELLARSIFQGSHGANLQRKQWTVPLAKGDSIFVQLPGLGLYVQACRRRALRHRRPPRPPARAPLSASQAGRKGTHQQRRQRASSRKERRRFRENSVYRRSF